MATSDLRAWAVKGAEQRLVEIAEEAREIFPSFPELRGRRGGFELPDSSTRSERKEARTAGGASRRRRRKRKMSAATRKAVIARMKKYWAPRGSSRQVAADAAGF